MPALPGFRDMISRIERDHTPFLPQATNFWLKVDGFDLRALVSALGLSRILPAEPPKLSLTFIGDGESVRTRGQLDFPKPLPYRDEKWNIPTNLMSQPLVSFTAIRGIAPWLSSLKAWNGLQIGGPPNQVYSWALQGPMRTYFAAAQPD